MVKPYTKIYKSIRMNVFVSLAALMAMLLTTFNTSNNVIEFTWMTFLSYFIYFQCVLRSAVCCWLVSLSPCGPQVVASNSIAAQTSCVANSDYMGPYWEHWNQPLVTMGQGNTHLNQPLIMGARLGTHTEINLWLLGTKTRNTEISLWLHHQGYRNNPIFWNLELYAACWAHFSCHDELWPSSMSHPFSFLNRKTLPVKYYSYLWTSSKFCSSTLLSLHSFLYFSPYLSVLGKIMIPMYRLWLYSL